MTDKFDLVTRNVNIYEHFFRSYARKIDGEGNKEIIDKFIYDVGSGRILDVGCAQGRDSKKFSDAGFEVVGIDLSKSLLNEAEKHVPDAFFYLMDARNVDFKKEVFDGIYASAVLLCMDKKDAGKSLKGFHQIAKEDSTLFLSLKKGEGYLESKLGDDKIIQTLYEQQEAEKIIDKAGWVTVDYLENMSAIEPSITWMNYFCRKK